MTNQIHREKENTKWGRQNIINNFSLLSNIFENEDGFTDVKGILMK